MGGVVRRNGVDGSVREAFDEGFPVVRAPQRRVHLEASVLPEVVFAEGEVMRPGLAGDAHPAGLGGADELHALARTYMTHVITAAGFLSQREVAGDLPPLAFGADAPVPVGGGVAAVVDISALQEGIVFAVGRDDDVFPGGGFHGPAHHRFVLDAASVVGECDAAVLEGGDIDQFQSFPAFGDGAVGEDVDDRVPVDGRLFHGEGFRTVRHGVQVGHGADDAVSAPGRGGGSGGDGFLGREAGLAEMDMDVGEGLCHEQAARFHDDRPFRGVDAGSDGGDFPVPDQNVPGAYSVGGGYEASLQQKQVTFHRGQKKDNPKGCRQQMEMDGKGNGKHPRLRRYRPSGI